MEICNLIELVLLLSCLGSFSWATIYYFNKSKERNIRQKIFLLCVYIIGTLHILGVSFDNQINPDATLIATILYLLSLWVFWSAVRAVGSGGLRLFFDGVEPDRLVMQGPYRLIRHPFYSSYLLCWLAGVVATGELLLLPTILLAAILYTLAAKSEEKTLLAAQFSEHYAKYKSSTGMFWPKFI